MFKLHTKNGTTVNYSKINFPCGETHIKLDNNYTAYSNTPVGIQWTYENDAEIFELLLICDALKRAGSILNFLHVPYFPHARQDRVANLGEALSVKVLVDLINNLKFKEVFVEDPHSDVLPALLNNCEVIYQHEIFSNYFYMRSDKDFYLISPDGGALKKIYKLAKEVEPLEVVECSKLRDTKTGEITGVIVHKDDLQQKDCYIVDDICDGGRTFIEIAKILKQKNAGKITLMVSHGKFTKGLEVFNEVIDEIFTGKEKVK